MATLYFPPIRVAYPSSTYLQTLSKHMRLPTFMIKICYLLVNSVITTLNAHLTTTKFDSSTPPRLNLELEIKTMAPIRSVRPTSPHTNTFPSPAVSTILRGPSSEKLHGKSRNNTCHQANPSNPLRLLSFDTITTVRSYHYDHGCNATIPLQLQQQ